MKKIILTGGPCAGKSTVLDALAAQGRTVVPEVARQLLALLPVPGTHCDRTPEWQAHLQDMILQVQIAAEDGWQKFATVCGTVFDLSILDGAAYTPGGVDAFCDQHGLDKGEVLRRYDAVIHLQSLAVADPQKYEELRQPPVYLPLERAQEVEEATLVAWQDHPNRYIIEGSDIEKKKQQTLGLVAEFLSQ